MLASPGFDIFEIIRFNSFVKVNQKSTLNLSDDQTS